MSICEIELSCEMSCMTHLAPREPQMTSPDASHVPLEASSAGSLKFLEKASKKMSPQSSYSQSTGFSRQRAQSSKKKQNVSITPSVASRQLQLVAQAPYASFRKLTIPGILTSGGGNDFRHLHFSKQFPGITAPKVVVDC